MQIETNCPEVTKACTKCGLEKNLTCFSKAKKGKFGKASVCKPCRTLQNNVWAKENKASCLKRSNEWHRKNRYRYREKNNARMRSNYKKLKQKIFEHYGNFCTCCGESAQEFLTLDHINSDGHIQRKNYGRGVNFFRYVLKMLPIDLTVLCFNCNCAKGIYGICPHKKEESNAI